MPTDLAVALAVLAASAALTAVTAIRIRLDDRRWRDRHRDCDHPGGGHGRACRRCRRSPGGPDGPEVRRA